MISEFQDLSDKIDRLAAMTQSLRHENTELRQNQKRLAEVNYLLVQRLNEAQRRVEALLAQLPAPAQDSATDPTDPTEATE
jgi:uncharacterized protein (TIGR02449 family)